MSAVVAWKWIYVAMEVVWRWQRQDGLPAYYVSMHLAERQAGRRLLRCPRWGGLDICVHGSGFHFYPFLCICHLLIVFLLYFSVVCSASGSCVSLGSYMATEVQSRQILFLCGSTLFPLYCMNADMLAEHCSMRIADVERVHPSSQLDRCIATRVTVFVTLNKIYWHRKKKGWNLFFLLSLMAKSDFSCAFL